MKLILNIQIRTALGYGGRVIFKMFEHTKIFDINAHDILTIMNGCIHNYSLQEVKADDNETLTATSFQELKLSSDSLTYYKKLTSQGWIPNRLQAEEIRNIRYFNFFPENF